MARKASTTPVPMRRCIGSPLIGVEAHEAPPAEFPVQPSQKDGLGRMCKPHWNAYTRQLRINAKARAEAAATEPAGEPEAPAAKPAKAPKASRVDPAKVARIKAAKALVDEVDRMPAPEAAKAAGTDEVQEAMRIVANASLGGEHAVPEEAAV